MQTWLSFMEPLYCLFSATYTIFVMILLILASPVACCRPACSLKDAAVHLLSPIFARHLRFLHSSTSERAKVHELEFRPWRLVTVHLLSPFGSVGVAVAAWIAAFFWVFAMIMGNPDGTEHGSDGRRTVIAVRNWWEGILLHAVK